MHFVKRQAIRAQTLSMPSLLTCGPPLPLLCGALQIAGCERTPRYGVPGQPLSFCQGHKRAGMYTCREGELFVATRDGSGEPRCCTVVLC